MVLSTIYRTHLFGAVLTFLSGAFLIFTAFYMNYPGIFNGLPISPNTPYVFTAGALIFIPAVFLIFHVRKFDRGELKSRYSLLAAGIIAFIGVHAAYYFAYQMGSVPHGTVFIWILTGWLPALGPITCILTAFIILKNWDMYEETRTVHSVKTGRKKK